MSTGKKVLLAEDDEAISEVVSIILREAGYTVIVPKKFLEIIDALNNESWDLVLLDSFLWNEDGIKVCKKIKTEKKLRHIPVIFLTARTDAKQLAIDAGANDILEKPFDIDELLAKVKNYIS